MKDLSICITVKNRSRFAIDSKIYELFPNCIDSLAKQLTPEDNCEIVITDWCSTDWPIRDWIENRIPNIPIHLITIKSSKGFSRGKGRNIAAQHAEGKILFFLDADMLFKSREVITVGMHICSNNIGVAFPKGLMQTTPDGNICKQIVTGAGNFFINKQTFKQTKGIPEYWQWGFEDLDFQKQLIAMNIRIINIQTTNFIHQWHPNNEEWKNKEATITQETKEHIEQRKNYYRCEINNSEEEVKQRLEQFAMLNLRRPGPSQQDDRFVGQGITRIGELK